jgi:dihydropteroate synthase
MGVLNVTPDSFYDGGRYLGAARAIARGREMVEQGADLVDIGGESTRPGAMPVDPDEELERVIPVIEALAGEVRVSIDTRHAEVAEAAIRAGATLLNDVSATLAPVAARCGVGLVIMHMQGTPADMQRDPRYDDVVAEVHGSLASSAATAHSLGVRELYVDPGIGFGKTAEHNVALLGALGDLVAAGEPVLLGTSRKNFLGLLGARPGANALPPTERLEGSLATALLAAEAGCAIVRVHDVLETVRALRIAYEELGEDWAPAPVAA